MKRYQIVYSKRGFPMSIWIDDLQDARAKAAQLRAAGYDVQIWLHDGNGARMLPA